MTPMLHMLPSPRRGAIVHQDVLRLDFAPPMFTFADPDNNLLMLIEEGSKSSGTDVSKPSS
jgi:hypothetical protein